MAYWDERPGERPRLPRLPAVAPSEIRSTKSADGRMATEAAQLENQEPTGRRKTDLTLTGLLMEGVMRPICTRQVSGDLATRRHASRLRRPAASEAQGARAGHKFARKAQQLAVPGRERIDNPFCLQQKQFGNRIAPFRPGNLCL